ASTLRTSRRTFCFFSWKVNGATRPGWCRSFNRGASSREPLGLRPSAWSRTPTSATPTSTARFALSRRSAQRDQPVDEVHDAVRVAPLVVVPGQDLEPSVAIGAGGEGVEDRRMRVADDVGGDQRHLAVLHDPPHRALSRGPDRRVDVFDRRLFQEPQREVYDRAVRHGYADCGAVQLSLQTR